MTGKWAPGAPPHLVQEFMGLVALMRSEPSMFSDAIDRVLLRMRAETPDVVAYGVVAFRTFITSMLAELDASDELRDELATVMDDWEKRLQQ